jgi:hypothetical protein
MNLLRLLWRLWPVGAIAVFAVWRTAGLVVELALGLWWSVVADLVSIAVAVFFVRLAARTWSQLDRRAAAEMKRILRALPKADLLTSDEAGVAFMVTKSWFAFIFPLPTWTIDRFVADDVRDSATDLLLGEELSTLPYDRFLFRNGAIMMTTRVIKTRVGVEGEVDPYDEEKLTYRGLGFQVRQGMTRVTAGEARTLAAQLSAAKPFEDAES